MRRAANNALKAMPRIVVSAPNRIVISNMMTTYGGTEPTGLPPTTTGQSYDIHSVSHAPIAQPAMPPISVNMRTGLTGGLAERVFDLMTRNRREHREVGVAGGAQLLDRVERRVEEAEDAEHARRRWGVEERGHAQRRTHRVARTWPRRGGARTSFTSEIDTAGKFFTNRRNHMKNQPKLPAMMRSEEHTSELQ